VSTVGVTAVLVSRAGDTEVLVSTVGFTAVVSVKGRCHCCVKCQL